MRGFDLQAHRGGRGGAPENTLAAFSQSLRQGVTTLELDIGLTGDGVVVITHDTALNPEITRNESGDWLSERGARIWSLTLAELQSYDVGEINPQSPYRRRFPDQQPVPGERIPTLRSLFQLVQKQGNDQIRFNIETKIDPTQPEQTASAAVMVAELLEVIDAAKFRDRTTIQSFDWRTLTLIRELAPEMSRAYLTRGETLADPRWTLGLKRHDYSSIPAFVQAAAGESSAPIIWSPEFSELTREQVSTAHQLRQQVLPWTVNDSDDMRRLIEWQVDGLITDFADRALDVLGE